MEELMRIEGLKMYFGGLKAIDGFDLVIKRLRIDFQRSVSENDHFFRFAGFGEGILPNKF